MTASDLHQRMLHLLDRAKAMSSQPPHVQSGGATDLSAEAEEPPHIPDVAPTMDISGETTPADANVHPAANPADSRSEARHKVLRKGKITFANGTFEVECQVRDLNTTGAKLKLSGDVTVPSSFDITIYPEKVTKTAQVCWRDELMLGIRFINV